MRSHNVNIYFPEETYSQIKDLISQRKISRFVNEAVQEKLAQKKQQEKKQLLEQLKRGYQAMSKNKKIKEELKVWEDTLTDSYKKHE